MSESEKLLGDTPSSTAPAPAHAEPAAPPKAAAAAAPQPLPPPAPAPVAPAAAPAPKPPAAAQPHAAQQLDDDELFFTAQETTFTTPQGGYATLPPSYAPDPLLYSGGGPYHPPQPRFDHAPPAQPGSDAAVRELLKRRTKRLRARDAASRLTRAHAGEADGDQRAGKAAFCLTLCLHTHASFRRSAESPASPCACTCCCRASPSVRRAVEARRNNSG